MKQRLAIFSILFLFSLLSPLSVRAEESTTLFSLQDCISLATEKAPQVQQAEAVRHMRNEELSSARKDLLPVLSTGYTYQWQPDASTPFYSLSDNYFSYHFTVEQPLYQGKALVTAVKVGELQVKASDRAYQAQVNDLVLDVSKAYYEYLKNIKWQEVAGQAIERLQSHLKDATAFYDAGLIPKNDLLESEVQLSQGQLDLLQAQNATELSRTSLNILMRRPATEELQVQDISDVRPTTVEWQSLLDRAIASRPEIANAKNLIEISNNESTIAKAPYLPSLSLSASYLRQGDDVLARNYDILGSEVRQARANVSWRFWSWGQKDARVAAAMAKKMQAEKELTALIDSVTMQARDAYLNHERAIKNIEVTKTAVDYAEENYRINESRYQAQLNTSTDVLDAQTLLSRAKANYFSSLYDYAAAMARIDWVTASPLLADDKK